MAEDPDKIKFTNLTSDGRPRTIHFATTHQNALKVVEGKSYLAQLTSPFRESISTMLFYETKLGFRKSRFSGWWLPITSIQVYRDIEMFIKKHRTTVFIRDLLPVSCALDKNFREKHPTQEAERTTLGLLEYQAKYSADENAAYQLADIAAEFINTTIYKRANIIIGVPSSKLSRRSLPQQIAKLIADKTHLEDASSLVRWCKDKPELKNIRVEEKWVSLDRVGICLPSDGIAGKHIILLDDLYQSGTTLNFIASRLKSAGAKLVYGLALVKSWSNSDNVQEDDGVE